jgi:multisubunit Na+/H+ antiporter MnhB subunit
VQSLLFVFGILFGAWLGARRPDLAVGAIWTFAGALVLTLLIMVIEALRSPPEVRNAFGLPRGLFSSLYLGTVFAISVAAILSAAFFGRQP